MPYPSFTSESVCAGHPDKICDQISDAIVDAVLEQDPRARTAVEAAATEGRVVLLGEISTTAKVDYAQVARREITRLGYTDPKLGFADNAAIDNYIGTQSAEIAQGVDLDGAGDQGMMFGYACRETPELMPLPIMLAHRLTKALDEARESGKLGYLRPDGKAQVTVRYENDKPVEVTHVTVAIPHREDIQLAQVRADIRGHIVDPILSEYGFKIGDGNFIVNGTGVWHLPGPRSDAGLTGRKIVVDGYGGYARVGGGAFSGKDPSKVDRSGAYAARYLAKNLVAAGLADRAEVALAYFIGAKKPVMQEVETFGTAHASDQEIADFMTELLDTSVAGIVKGLDLRRPIYKATAAYGHFGRAEFPWEQVKVPAVQAR
ncbi:MAG: methionine adenosyltransferase [Patescibacteria group bacterium]|nr:methionine adenosyltransferase [Patescibacteria group bacterium]